MQPNQAFPQAPTGFPHGHNFAPSTYSQPNTSLRPLPPLPAHLHAAFHANHRPSSPSSLPEPHLVSLNSPSGGATPPVAGGPGTAGPSSTPSTPHLEGDSPAGDEKKKRGRPIEREGDAPGSRLASPQGAQADSEAEVKKTKKVKVGARASIACIACRKRKVRCSGNWPTCTFCEGRNLSCVYEGHPAENGGPTNGGAGFGFALSTPSPEPVPPPPSIVLAALETFFSHNYDTFPFLHRPTLIEQASNGTVPRELLYCILAFAARHCVPLRDGYYAENPDKLTETSPSEHYANIAAQLLQFHPSPITVRSSSPGEQEADISLVRCQAYLILGLHECTEGTENRGWMKIGIAIRMAQVLRLGFEDEDENPLNGSPAAPPLRTLRRDPLKAEIRRRTFWACFLLDRTITDGKERPCSLHAPKNGSLRMPSSEEDFTKGVAGQGARFEVNDAPWALSARLQHEPAPAEPEADLYGHTLRVSQLWQRVADYTGAGGRNVDRRPPWVKESTFAILAADLSEFETRLPEMYEYSEANLLAHSMIGQGRLFGMFHLLLACSLLVLHRDYVPFLPTINYNAAEGPIDGEPLWGSPSELVAPADWWMSSLSCGFNAANNISDLCTYLAQHGSQITHPFAGFAAVAAATMHVHLKYWPRSSPNHANAPAYLEQDARIVASLRDVYPIAGLWVEGLQRLSHLYFNLARGSLSLGGDPAQVRESVLKLLRTAHGAAARETETGTVGEVSRGGLLSTDSRARSTSSQRRSQLGVGTGMMGLGSGESLYDPTLPFEFGGGIELSQGAGMLGEEWAVGAPGGELNFFSSGWGWGSGF